MYYMPCSLPPCSALQAQKQRGTETSETLSSDRTLIIALRSTLMHFCETWERKRGKEREEKRGRKQKEGVVH
jgi:hypothetical protein